MEHDPRGKKTGKRGWGRTIFLLALVVECILIGCLIWGKSVPSRALPRRLSAEEAERYESYSISLPDAGGRAPSAAGVLAYCTFQEEKTVGSARYTFYTSDALPEYIHQCAAILEIMETSEGTVYITYTSQNAERVILTISDSGIIQKDIYAEKTDTYYDLSASGSHKYLHFRHSPSVDSFTAILAGVVGAALLLSFALYRRGRRGEGHAPFPD